MVVLEILRKFERINKCYFLQLPELANCFFPSMARLQKRNEKEKLMLTFASAEQKAKIGTEKSKKQRLEQKRAKD